MYDHCDSYRFTADTNAALPTQTKIHKISLLNGTLTATASIKVHDAATVTGDPVAEVHADLKDGTTYRQRVDMDFNPPLFMEIAASLDITGSSAVGYIYYTR